MENDITALLEEIKTVASGILKKDIAKLKGFNARQLEAIAKQTDMLKNAILAGTIDDDLKEFFMQCLEAMVLNFLNTLIGLVAVTVEKVWNAIVDLLWKTIGVVA
jgi:hypothetical protein